MDEIGSLKRQYAKVKVNLLKIEEREADFIDLRAVPPDLQEAKKRLLQRIKEIEQRLAELDYQNGNGHDFGDSSTSNTNDISFQEREELVEYLLVIPSIANRDTLDIVIDELRFEIKMNIRNSSVHKTYVWNIVKTCLQYPNGMQNLRNILQFFEGDSIPMQKFQEALNRLLPIS